MSRTERYRKRCGDEGETEDADNPLPGYMDPITFQPVNNPAISPWGHVMGLATWKVAAPPIPADLEQTNAASLVCMRL